MECTDDQRQQLITSIQQNGNDRETLNKYFDLLQEMLNENQIRDNSPEIAMTLIDGLKVVVGGQNRSVVRLLNLRISLILPNAYKDEIIRKYSIAVVVKKYFKNNAFWSQFNSSIIPPNSTDQNTITQWKIATRNEITNTRERRGISKQRVHHNFCFYKAVMEQGYRNSIFERAGVN